MIQTTLEHYTSVVNMLGKAEMFNEAYEFMSKLTHVSTTASKGLDGSPPC
jgi:pentatricopeptide repeat protein